MSLVHRMDNRKKEVFRKDISRDTLREKVAACLWRTILMCRGYKQVTYEDNGVDNSGELIEGYVPASADFKFSIISSTGDRIEKLIEFKVHCSKFQFCTIKKESVCSAIKKKEDILVICDRHSLYFKYENLPKIMADILAVPRDSFGGKLTYRIHKQDYYKYCTFIDYTENEMRFAQQANEYFFKTHGFPLFHRPERYGR